MEKQCYVQGVGGMPKVILDPGHGGSDIGDYYRRRSEKNDNLRLALRVGELLQNMGVDVEYTRTADVYLPMLRRVDRVNQIGGDLLVSLHRSTERSFNEYPTLELYVGSDDPVGVEAADNIRESLAESGFRNYKLVERRDLPLLNDTNMPSVMLAIGYFRSDEDNRYFDENLSKIADGIAEGIYKTLQQEDIIGMQEENRHLAGADCRYCILTGPYSSYALAMEAQMRLHSQGYDTQIDQKRSLYVIYIGKYADLDEAASMELLLRKCGYDAQVIHF